LQLDLHAFGAVDEDLAEIGVGNIVIFVAIAASLDAFQRRPEFVKAEGDMVEDAGWKIGAARCQAEMDDRAGLSFIPRRENSSQYSTASRGRNTAFA